jgi:hypothetical protein
VKGFASINPFGVETTLKELSQKNIIQILMPWGGVAK